MKLALFADGHVGQEITNWLLSHYIDDVEFVITLSRNDIYEMVSSKNITCFVYESENQIITLLKDRKIDLGVLLWWSKIISKEIITLSKYGFINTHPSLLPYNRGKHYNFWAIVEKAPFGVSLHFVDEGIDSGDLIAQSEIFYSWEDNGESLFIKANSEMIKLFKQHYPSIRKKNFVRKKQDLTLGSLHYAKELDAASEIDLKKFYTAIDLFNLLRARTFTGYPSCWFKDSGEVYEVKIEITRKNKNELLQKF